MGHQMGPEQISELTQLMKEYPDWSEQHPDVARELHQPRFHKNRQQKGQSNARVMPKRSTTVPLSDYQSTYQHHNTRPRSSKKPPPTPMNPCPPPMTFSTNQRSDFIPKDPRVRPQPIILKDNHERLTGPFEAESTYNKAYVPIEISPQQALHPHPSITDGQMKQPRQMPFNGVTTNKDHYKRWVSRPAVSFTELPTFTGSILYPEVGHDMSSTTQTTFTGRQGERVGLIRHSHGHIGFEGDHNMSTTTSSTYQSFEDPRPAQKVVHKSQLPVRRREPFQAKSQSADDYGSYVRAGQPLPARPVQPHPETIELRFNNKTHFTTEQSSKYTGIDVAAHPPPRPIVPDSDNQVSMGSGGKIEGVSRSHSDYKPHDVRQAFVPPVKPIDESQRRGNLPKFNSETSNKHYYKHWAVEPRKRYIDFHEGHKYIPPQSKFEGVSTTKTTFAGTRGQLAAPFLPVDNSLQNDGNIDFDTIYKNTFNNNSPLKKLSKDQMNKVLNDLRKRKQVESRFTEQNVMFAQGVGSA